MPVPRTAEEAFASYVLLRAVSPRGWATPDAGRRPVPDRRGIHRALAVLVNQPEQAGLDLTDDANVVGELQRIADEGAGPAELLNLSAAAAALCRATNEQVGQP